MVKQLSISGFRGFGEKQTISFSLPNGEKNGSGLNIITGANNSGKTTIIEALRGFNNTDTPSFSEGKRNIETGGKVELKVLDENNYEHVIKTVSTGGSSTDRIGNFGLRFYIVQSRRAIEFEFHKNTSNREFYISSSLGINNLRTPSLNNFTYRIFQIEENRDKFDPVLSQVLGDDFEWTIEQRDSGSYYIKYMKGGISHSAEGIGDGIWSIFTICAALYDAPENSTVVIDEPELSLHPDFQKKLMILLMEYSRRIQIIICTHSPYFINWEAISNGANLIRVVKEETKSKCYGLNEESRYKISGILNDINNPHTLGLDANEIFFLNDGIILVEGQEDVLIYKRIAGALEEKFNGNFFGWGAGGAHKIPMFLSIFKSLGYKKVVALYDGDKKEVAEIIKKQFPEYCFIILKEDDIRDKSHREIKGKNGIADEKGDIKPENKEYMKSVIQEINNYLV